MDAMGQKIVEEQLSSPCIFVHELQVALPKSSSFSSHKANNPTNIMAGQPTSPPELQ